MAGRLWRWWNRTSPAGRVLAVFNLALLGWYLLRPEPGGVFIWGVVVGGVVGPAVAVWWSLAACRGAWPGPEGRRHALAVRLLTAGTAFFLVGNAYYYLVSVARGGAVVFPSLADAFFVLAYPCQIAAVLIRPLAVDPGADDRYAGDRLTGGGGRRLLDALLAAAAVTTVSWYLLLAPILSQTGGDRLTLLLSASYPVLDLIVLACLLVTAGRARYRCTASRLLAAGLAAIAITDSLYAHALVRGTYVNGHLLDLGWPLGYMLVGLSVRAMRRDAAAAAAGTGTAAGAPDPAGHPPATRTTTTTTTTTTTNTTRPPRRTPARQGTPHAWLAAILPYAAFVLVAGLAFSASADHDGPGGELRRGGAAVGFVAIAAMLLARQQSVIRQNAALNERMRDVVTQLSDGHASLAAANETLRRSEERFRIASECAGDLIYEWDLDAGTLTWFGDIDRLLGHEPGGFSHTLTAWTSAIHPDDRRRVTQALDRHIGTGDRFDVEYRVARADGRYLHWTDRGRAVIGPDGEPTRMIGAVADVTAAKQAEERLRHESLHDALTGLPNRALFVDRVERCVERARRGRLDGGGWHYAVLFLDLDRFKLVNDSLGHAAGDRLLTVVAERLATCLRSTDSVSRAAPPAAADGDAQALRGVTFAGAAARDEHTLARLGGDEFTVLLEGLARPGDAESVAARILHALAEPIPFDGHEVFACASVGVVHGSDDYRGARDLLRDADVAMYRAKAAGRGRYAVFDATMHTEAVARLQMEGDLRRAIERREMTLVYQPVVSLQTGAVTGVEALVRWRRPDGTPVGPAEFIPVAEDTGLIVPLGNWVMAEACRQMAEWRAAAPAAFADLSVAVNVSGRQLADADALLAMVRDTLAATGLPATALKVEITEGVMMEPGAATGVLARLRDAGVTLHMDDFGTGYSSLSRLHCFPIQGLKIDRSFIAQTADGQTSIALLQSIVALAHHLGIRVVAEGVETSEQVALLQTLECDFAQGYLFARPLAPDKIAAFVAAARPPGLPTAA